MARTRSECGCLRIRWNSEARGEGVKITVESGDISAAKADAIVVNLFEGVTSPGGGTGAVDRAVGGMISELIASGDLRGKWGDITTLYTQGKIASPRVVVAGLGSA